MLSNATNIPSVPDLFRKARLEIESFIRDSPLPVSSRALKAVQSISLDEENYFPSAIWRWISAIFWFASAACS